MNKQIELLDTDITIERKNLILAKGETDEISFNIDLPVNSVNKNGTNFSIDNITTTNDCMVNIGNSNVLSTLNIDSYVVNENKLSATLYYNKIITDYLNTPIRNYIVDEEFYTDADGQHEGTLIKWTPFCQPRAFANTDNEWRQIIPNHMNFFVNSYCNGANNHYGKDITYYPYYYNPEFDDDSFTEYATEGCGCFKNWQYHPTLRFKNCINLLNDFFKSKYNFNAVDVDSLNDGSIITGNEKMSPYNRNQWCSWVDGKKYTTTAKLYNDGRNGMKIDVLGDHIITQNSDDYSVKFNRNCQIQITKIHLNAEHGTGPNDATVELVIFDNNDNIKQTLFSIPFANFANGYTNSWYGLHNVNRSASSSFFGMPILNTLDISTGDSLRLIINANNGKKARVQYLNVILKWKYVENSYYITDDDFDTDLNYYSGFLTQAEDIDHPSDFRRSTQQATANQLRKRFDPTTTEIIMDTWQHGMWSEPFVKCYYGAFNNLGELTILQLVTYMAMANGYDLYFKENGQLTVKKITEATQLNNTELTEIQYLNEKFGKNNYIEYGDGNLVLGGKSRNDNLANTATVFQTGMYTSRPIITQLTNTAYYFPTHEQDGEIEEGDEIKVDFNSIGNFTNINGTDYIDEIFKYDLPKYIYNFTVYGDNFPLGNVITVDGIRYMVTDNKMEVNNKKCTIKCFRF